MGGETSPQERVVLCPPLIICFKTEHVFENRPTMRGIEQYNVEDSDTYPSRESAEEAVRSVVIVRNMFLLQQCRHVGRGYFFLNQVNSPHRLSEATCTEHCRLGTRPVALHPWQRVCKSVKAL